MEIADDLRFTHKATILGLPEQPTDPSEAVSRSYVDSLGDPNKIEFVDDNRKITKDDDKLTLVITNADVTLDFSDPDIPNGTRVLVVPSQSLLRLKGDFHPSLKPQHNLVKGQGVSIGFIYSAKLKAWITLGGLYLSQITPIPPPGVVRLVSFPVADDDGFYVDNEGLLWYVPNGHSIGPTASDADINDNRLQALYKIIWTHWKGSSVAGGKGRSSESDWDANKVLEVPAFTHCLLMMAGARVASQETSKIPKLEFGQPADPAPTDVPAKDVVFGVTTLISIGRIDLDLRGKF